jgi:hypothetical protein
MESHDGKEMETNTPSKQSKDTSSSMEETPVTKLLQDASMLQDEDLVASYHPLFKKNKIHGPRGILMLESEDWKDLNVPVGDKRAILSAAQAQVGPTFPLPSSNKVVALANASDDSPAQLVAQRPAQDQTAIDKLTLLIESLSNRIVHDIHPVATGNVDSSRLDKILKMTEKAGSRLKSACTLKKYTNSQRWYEKTFGMMNQQSLDDIVENLCKYVLDDSDGFSAATKRTRIEDIKALLKIQNRSIDTNGKQGGCITGVTQLLSKQEDKDRRSGKSVGWVAFSDLDYLHMMNSIIMYYGALPDSELQTLHQLLMGKTTGRHSGEIQWLAAASWTIDFLNCDGQILRTMRCVLCNKKIDGPGKYTVCFAEPMDENTEVNLVVITLLLLERKKMINSALSVYDEAEVLSIDANVFETADELHAKLLEATDLMKEDNLGKLEETTDADIEEAVLPAGVVFYVRELDKKQGDKIPFYTTCSAGLQTSTRSSSFAGTIKEFGVLFGWTPSRSLRFGGTCARKGARQDDTGEVRGSTNKEKHLNHQLGHTSNVALRHYENYRDYNNAIPANLLQKSTDPKLLQKVVSNFAVRASFEDPTFFNQAHPKLLDRLPPSRDFLQAYAHDPESDPEAAFVCLGDDCEKQFLYCMDWRKHMSSRECGSRQFHGCCWCPMKFNNSEYIKVSEHLSFCKGRPASTFKMKPVVAKAEAQRYSCECGRSFAAKKGLARHKKEHCKVAKGKLKQIEAKSDDDDEKKPKAKTTKELAEQRRAVRKNAEKMDEDSEVEMSDAYSDSLSWLDKDSDESEKVPEAKTVAAKRKPPKRAIRKKLKPVAKYKKLDATVRDDESSLWLQEDSDDDE